MLEIDILRNDIVRCREGLKKRNITDTAILEQVIALDDKRKSLQTESDSLLSESNGLSKQIGKLYATGHAEEANTLKAKVADLKEKIRKRADDRNCVEDELRTLLVQIPNIPNDLVPHGNSETDNDIVRSGGEMPVLSEHAIPHWELAKKYNIIDFELGNKVTGAGFPFYLGKGAKLQRALINFFLNEAEKAGYKEIQAPLVVNEETGFATGQLPDKEGQMYQLTDEQYYLIPTAEVPLTNIYRDTILKEDELPIRLTGYTACFRREAGSYGKDVRGLNRLHQFDKVEVVHIEHPDRSYDTLTKMVAHVESLVVKLGLPYRILRLCGGDLGFTSALTYDFEVYSAAQDKWLEVSSISNFETFQSNRMKLRFQPKEGKGKKLTHTLNGSALALPRIVAALLENNQKEEGIVVPEVLRAFTGFDLIN